MAYVFLIFLIENIIAHISLGSFPSDDSPYLKEISSLNNDNEEYRNQASAINPYLNKGSPKCDRCEEGDAQVDNNSKRRKLPNKSKSFFNVRPRKLSSSDTQYFSSQNNNKEFKDEATTINSFLNTDFPKCDRCNERGGQTKDNFKKKKIRNKAKSLVRPRSLGSLHTQIHQSPNLAYRKNLKHNSILRKTKGEGGASFTSSGGVQASFGLPKINIGLGSSSSKGSGGEGSLGAEGSSGGEGSLGAEGSSGGEGSQGEEGSLGAEGSSGGEGSLGVGGSTGGEESAQSSGQGSSSSELSGGVGSSGGAEADPSSQSSGGEAEKGSRKSISISKSFHLGLGASKKPLLSLSSGFSAGKESSGGAGADSTSQSSGGEGGAGSHDSKTKISFELGVGVNKPKLPKLPKLSLPKISHNITAKKLLNIGLGVAKPIISLPKLLIGKGFSGGVGANLTLGGKGGGGLHSAPPSHQCRDCLNYLSQISDFINDIKNTAAKDCF